MLWVWMGEAWPRCRTRKAVCEVTWWMKMGDMVVEHWKREIPWCVAATVKNYTQAPPTNM